MLSLAVTSCSDGAGPAPAPPSGAPAVTPSTVRPSADAPAHLARTRLGLRPGWGPSWASLDRAARFVRDLPLPDLAGQVIVARYPGTAAPVDLVNQLHLGGVVVFDSNVSSAAALGSALRRLQRESDRPWPLWLSVDQEGGIVTRVDDGVTPFPNPMALGATDDVDLTERVAAVSGHDLARLGFTANLAPVADVTTPGDVTIRARAFGGTVPLVSRHARAYQRYLWESGLVPVVKHFPGHGAATDDSHLTLPTVPASLASLRRAGEAPFARLVAAGVPAVMVGHLRVPALDPRLPASLSPAVIDGELRRHLGFDGLVVTDALDMGAITGGSFRRSPAVLTLLAGADVVLMPANAASARAAIIDAVRADVLPRTRLEQAAARQIALLLEQQQRRRAAAARDVDGAPVATTLAERSLVVVAGACRGRLVGPAVRLRGEPDVVAAFRSAAARHGLRVGRTGPVVEFVGWSDTPRAGRIRRRQPPAVLVSTADAAVLDRSTVRTRVAAWGSTPATLDAVARLLVGDLAARGRLPVAGDQACG